MLLKTSFVALFFAAVAIAAPCQCESDPKPEPFHPHAPSKVVSDPHKHFPVPHKPKCKSDHFFYSPKSVCLPHGGPDHCSHPPAHRRCPGNDWYWFHEKDCCVPYFPDPKEHKCDHSWDWNSKHHYCEPHHRRPGHDFPIKPLPIPKTRPTKTQTVTVTVTPSPTAVSQCNTGGTHCCNQLQSSTDSDATKLLDAFGVKVHNADTGNNQTNVGINCSPVDGTGANCVEQPVCCQNNNFSGGDGAIIIGCAPINIFISGGGASDSAAKAALPAPLPIP